MVASTIPTCGFPEGDCMSVVAMLGVSRLWVELIQSEQMLPHAFADNWSWVTNNHRLHRNAMEQTLQLARAIRLTIDWGKTWIWGTKPIHTRTLQSVRAQLLNDKVQLQTVQDARELGHIIHYQLLPYRGTQKERHHQALVRLKKLAKQHWPIDDLAHIAQTACFAKALYGIETYACGEKYFQNLRSLLATVLVGPYANTNPYLAAMCASPYVKDPELQAIQQAIKAARDFLFATDLAHADEFFHHCVTCRAQPAQVIGPAGALQFYLAKLSWQLDKQGNIQIDAYISLHFLYAPLESILMAAELAWLQNLTTVAYTKKGQRNGPPINRRLTLRLLQQFPNSERKKLLREIVGSRMDEHQKATFVDDNEGLCLYCNQPDSVQHKVLYCDATEHIRTAFPMVVQHLSEFDTIHTHLPIIFMHQDWEFDRFLHYNATPPEIPTKRKCLTRSSLYTDGSCQFPSMPNRWTTYAIVRPVVDEQTILDSSNLSVAEICDSCFEIIAVAQGFGHQSIPRAELQAFVTAFKYDLHSRVVTDSSYVLTMLEKVKQVTHLKEIHMLPNFDLLQELFSLVQSANRPLFGVKIKAHEEFQSADRQLTLDRIGNAVADYVANSASRSLGGPQSSWRRQRCVEDQKAMHIRKQHYDMLLALDRERTKQMLTREARNITIEQQAIPYTRQHTLEQLANLALTDFQIFSSPVNVQDIVQISRFGQQPSQLVFQYLKMLKWPTEPPKEDVPLGISWLELYFNFQMVSGATIPVNVSTTPGSEKLVWMDEQQIFTVDSFPYHRYVQYFRLCVEHLQKFSHVRLWPEVSRRKTRSLHVLGCAGFRKGLSIRPILPYQTETVRALHSYMRSIPQRTQFDDHPMVPTVPLLLQKPDKLTQLTEMEIHCMQKRILAGKRRQNINNSG